MTILVTGAAGFIGSHVVSALLARGEPIVGIDNLNDYYDVALKRARLAQLLVQPGFDFVEADISDRSAMETIAFRYRGIDRIINLAAQAGVRHSLGHPRAYAKSNLTGFLEVLEFARNLPACRHLVYASSSSVYGASAALPFRVGDRVDQPVSLYAATKQANELMAATYSHLYRLPCTGLRYFTVYGPWGRPDMAPHLFTRAILTGQPIRLFNAGDMRRDFTYIDDVVRATIGCLDRPPLAQSAAPAHRVYNVGNHRSEALGDFVAALERACGRRAVIEPTPMQPGDVRDTFADIEDTKRDLAWQPTVSIKVGIPRFVAWFRDYYSL